MNHKLKNLATPKGRHYILRPLVVAITLSLTACTLPKDSTLSEVKAVNDVAYTQAIKDVAQLDWPSDEWWKRYSDAQLDNLIQEALANAPSMTIAQQRLLQAQAFAKQMGALTKPTVGLAADASMTKVSYAYQAYMPPEGWNDYGSVGLNFSYEFDFWGKNRAQVSAAASDFAAAAAEQASAQIALSTSVANAYAELARLYANLDTVKAALSVRNQSVDLLQKRFNNGLETQGAVSQAKSAALSVEAELLSVQEAIKLQKNAIAALMGQGPDRALMIQRPSVKLSDRFGLPSSLGVGLLGHRPEITAARWRVESAAQRIGVAKAAFYPNVSLSGFVGYQAYGIDNLANSGNDAGSIGPAIYLPLFTGGRLESQLDSANASYEIAVSQYNDSVNRALHEVANVVISTKGLALQISKTEQAVDAARQAHTIASNRYKGGLATYLDVLSAENALINSERALVNLRSKVFSLDLALVHALGGGFNSHAATDTE